MRKRESRWSKIDSNQAPEIVEPSPEIRMRKWSKNDSNQAQAGGGIVEPPPETRVWVEKTARLVALKGVEIENRIRSRNMDNPSFSFFMCSDPSHSFYQQKLTEYRLQNEDGTLDIQPDTPATHECVYNGQPFRLEPPPPLRNSTLPLKAFTCDCAFTFPAGMTLKELGIIKLTAQFLARYGGYFWRDLMTTVFKNPQFEFMKPPHSRFSFYTDLLLAYSRVLRTSTDACTPTVLEDFFRRLQLEKLDEGVVSAMIDLHAFVGGVDCFTYMEYAHHSLVMQPPQRLSMMMSRLTQMQPDQNQDGALDIQPDAPATVYAQPDLEPPPLRITLKDLGIIKLTAQFVARYGMYFHRALMMRVVNSPHFKFMEPTHSRYYIFNVLVDAYSRVLRPSKQLKKSDACTATVLEVFFHRLQLEKLEDTVETARIDLHAFVVGLDCFAHMEDVHYSAIMPPPEPISMMMNRLTQPHVLVPPPPRTLLSEYRAQNQDGAQDIQSDAPATHECVGDPLRNPPLKNLAFTFPAKITLKELGVMKLTAQFVARYGSDFCCDLMETVVNNPQFEFLNSRLSDEKENSRLHFYNGLVAAYCGVLKPSKNLKKSFADMASVLQVFFDRLQVEKLEEGVETAMIDLHAFMGGVDYVAHIDDVNYSAIMPPPQRLSTMMNRLTQMRPDMLVQPPLGSQHSEYRAQDEQPLRPGYLFPTAPRGWITLEELVVIKITALFVVRYGMHFCRELMKKVVMKPEFKFMEPADIRFSIYNVFVDAYSRVLTPAYDACTATILEAFFRCLRLKKLEEGVETAVIDLHAFVSGVDCFAQMEDVDYSTQMENVDYSAIMPQPQMKRLTKNHSGCLWGVPLGSQIVRLQLHPNPHPHPYDQFASLSMGMLVSVVRMR